MINLKNNLFVRYIDSDANIFSVFRIMAWAVLFLYLFGLALPPVNDVIPYADSFRNTAVTPRLLKGDDARWVSKEAARKPHAYKVAWIADSTSTVIPAGKLFETTPENEMDFLALKTAQKLQEKYKRKDVSIDLFLRLGLRPVDTMVLAQAALAEKPDILIMPVHMIWQFNTYHALNWPNSLGFAATLWWKTPKLWSLLPFLPSPSQNLWALAGRHFDALYDTQPDKAMLLDRARKLWAIPSEEPIKGNTPPAIASKKNYLLWIYADMLKHAEAGKTAKGNTSMASILRFILNQAITDQSSHALTEQINDATFSMLKTSGIPILLYSVPLAAETKQAPHVQETLQAMNDYIHYHTKDAANITYIENLPDTIYHSLEFRSDDGLHLKSLGNFDAFLAEKINQAIKNKEKNDDKKLHP